MKQKMTISLPINVDKCRAKAMKIAVGVAGVSSVNIDEAKNQLVIIGVGVDSFELIKCLKKKFKCASILSIEEVKPPPPAQQKDGGKKEGDKKEGEKKDGDKKKEEEKKKGDDCCKPCPCPCPRPCPPPNPCVQYYPVCQPFYDPYPQSTCSIQ
ncbi:heavy metal-associated isoprenylated plant protein 16-like [Ipomoea triloba]|uniref:heavy metal-associated isoprenylated plant protein 16-like n=1 Tax=Ipomoea triloba TaxID=35885 RepID=UPI00125D57CC|nr:heavy metal-associated isoprenylated plant protein 16-like [Ipomoea triloba]